MTKIIRNLRAALVLSALVLPSAACSQDLDDQATWLLGTWEKTHDEDQGPPDSITFRANGTFVTYDGQCKEHTNSYFVENDMVFLLIPMPKGPVALVLKPSNDKSSMTFTSPRTMNNAIYTPSKAPHCRPGG